MPHQDRKIISIQLDERNIIRRADSVEAERLTAINDLLAHNLFALRDAPETGPYELFLRVQDRKLLIDVKCTRTPNSDTISLALRPFQSLIKDYFLICESYYNAVYRGLGQIEAIDMGRRGLHNEAADMLMARLAETVEMDHNTARRLFTLLCVLHIKSF